MSEHLRFTCPCCGMMSYVDRLIIDKQYKVKVYSQKLGGKVAGAGKRDGKGKAPGKVEYKEVTKNRPDVIKLIKERIESLK